MNVASVLHEQARVRPNEAAILDVHRHQARRLTFAQLEQAAGRTARLFEQAGLTRGDAVLVFHPMSAELYIVLAAIFRLGLVAIFLDPSGGLSHIRRCCRVWPPRAWVAGWKAHALRLVSTELRRIPLKFSIGPTVPGAVPLLRGDRLGYESRIEPCDADTPALLTWTSGSTAEPKAAVRTHGFLLAQHRALEQALELTPGEVDLTTLPIFALANLGSGVTSLLADADMRHPAAIDPSRVVAQIDKHRPTRSGASPAFFQRLFEYCARHGRTLPSLRRVFTGGGPVTLGAMRRMKQAAPHAAISAIYGSTEAEPIARIDLDEITPDDAMHMQSGGGLLAGQPVSSIHLQIIRNEWGRSIGPFTAAEFASITQPMGEPGEIVVHGEHVLPAYVHGTASDETKFKVDQTPWHRTGDAGCLDSKGRLWLLGRCAAQIDDDRGILYPFSVEHIAGECPGVARVAIVSHRGRRVLAVELNGHRRNGILDELARATAFAKVDRVIACKRLPVDSRHNAKIDYPALRAWLERVM